MWVRAYSRSEDGHCKIPIPQKFDNQHLSTKPLLHFPMVLINTVWKMLKNVFWQYSWVLCGAFFYFTDEILGVRKKNNIKSMFYLEVSSQHSIFMWFPFLEFSTTAVGLLAPADPAGRNWCFRSKDSLPSGIHKHILDSAFFWGSLPFLRVLLRVWL